MREEARESQPAPASLHSYYFALQGEGARARGCARMSRHEGKKVL